MSSFQFKPVSTKGKFVKEFKKWLKHGQDQDLLSEFEIDNHLRRCGITPSKIASQFFWIYIIELRREGQVISDFLENRDELFSRDYIEQLKLRVTPLQGTKITEIADTKDFKKVIEKLEQAGFIKKWRNPKRLKRRQRLYGHIWNLFIIGFYQKQIATPPSKELFESIYRFRWHEPVAPEILEDVIE